LSAESRSAKLGSVRMSSAEVAVPPRTRGRRRHIEPSDEYVARRESIVTIAAEIFWLDGYDGGSLDAVADAAGLRKASLYHYVKKKSDLLRLIFDRVMSIAFREFDAAASIEDPREELAKLIEQQALLVAHNRPLLGVFFDQRQHLEPEDEARVSRQMHLYMAQFIQVVDAAMKAGALPAGDPYMVANSINGMANWAYRWFDPARNSPEEFAAACVQLVLAPRP
jgi:AcrR family transcriptional regulator